MPTVFILLLEYLSFYIQKYPVFLNSRTVLVEILHNYSKSYNWNAQGMNNLQRKRIFETL